MEPFLKKATELFSVSISAFISISLKQNFDLTWSILKNAISISLKPDFDILNFMVNLNLKHAISYTGETEVQNPPIANLSIYEKLLYYLNSLIDEERRKGNHYRISGFIWNKKSC
jgi:hypothetical protein